MRIDTLLVADIEAVKDKHVLESRPDDKWPPPGAPSQCGLWAVAKLSGRCRGTTERQPVCSPSMTNGNIP